MSVGWAITASRGLPVVPAASLGPHEPSGQPQDEQDRRQDQQPLGHGESDTEQHGDQQEQKEDTDHFVPSRSRGARRDQRRTRQGKDKTSAAYHGGIP